MIFLSRWWSGMIGGEGAFALWVSVSVSMCVYAVQCAVCQGEDQAARDKDSRQSGEESSQEPRTGNDVALTGSTVAP